MSYRYRRTATATYSIKNSTSALGRLKYFSIMRFESSLPVAYLSRITRHALRFTPLKRILGATFTAILPPALATTSAVINPDNVSTTVDVGLMAPPVPVVQSPTPIDEPIGDLAELVPIFTGENNEETAATDELFASVGTTGDELCPW